MIAYRYTYIEAIVRPRNTQVKGSKAVGRTACRPHPNVLLARYVGEDIEGEGDV